MDLTNPTRPRSVAHEDMSLRRGVLSRTVPQRLGKRPTNHRSRPFTVSIVRYHHCTSRFQSPFCFFSFVPDTIVVIPLYLLHCSVTLLFYCSPSAIVLTVDINPSTRYLETSVSTSCLQVSLTCISLVDTSLNTTCLQPCVSSLAPLSLHKRSSDALARLVVPSSSRLTPGRDTQRGEASLSEELRRSAVGHDDPGRTLERVSGDPEDAERRDVFAPVRDSRRAREGCGRGRRRRGR